MADVVRTHNVRDGLRVARLDDGTVRVTIDDNAGPVGTVDVPELEWCSAIAAVSPNEDAQAFLAAKRLHLDDAG